jgi:integrase
MKAKVALQARIAGKFITIPFKKGMPIVPEGAKTFYARYMKDGKRVSQHLAKESEESTRFADALLEFKNLQIAFEFTAQGLPVPEMQLVAVTPTVAPVTLPKKIEIYCEEISANKARKTWQAYKNSLTLFTSSCKKTHLHDLTREDMLAFKTYLRDQKFSQRSIYNNFLNVMVFLKWVGTTVGMKADDWPAKPEREPEEYTDDEIGSMLNAANTEERLLMNCFLCSGMRSGELAHLTYGDIDFKHSVWTVQPKDDWATKTRESQRDVPVPEWLTNKLADRMEAGKRGKTDLVFFNAQGKANLHMLRITQAVAKRAKITGRVDDHKFRSTAITRWLREGNTVPDVMKWVGHVNPTTILRYAAKVNVRNREMHQKAVGAFSRFEGVGD